MPSQTKKFPSPRVALENVAYEEYSQLRSKDESRADAWFASHPDAKCSRASAHDQAKRAECRPLVNARIAYLTRLRAEEVVTEKRRELNRDYKDMEKGRDRVMAELIAMKERCMEEIPVRNAGGRPIVYEDTNTGQEVALTKPLDARTAIKALELQGIDYGMFVRQSRSGKIDEYEGLTEQQIVDRLQAGLEQYGLTVTRSSERTADGSAEDSGTSREGEAPPVSTVQ